MKPLLIQKNSKTFSISSWTQFMTMTKMRIVEISCMSTQNGWNYCKKLKSSYGMNSQAITEIYLKMYIAL